MISAESKAVAKSARRIYDSPWREELERKHPGKYVCIEPMSASYFLGDTFDGAKRPERALPNGKVER